MKTLNVIIWDDCAWDFKVTVPSNVSETEVVDILRKEHKYLCTEDKEDIYEIQGKDPSTLLDYVCEKYDWSWRKFEYDIDITLD